MWISPACAFPCLDVLCPLPRWTGPGASVGCFPRPCCLPRVLAGSASTTSLSRPAQALHTLRPVDSLDRPKRPLSQGFDTASYPTTPPASYRANRPLPGWDSHPLGERALRGRTKARRWGQGRGSACDSMPATRVSKCVIDGLGAARKHQRVLRASPCCICAGFLSVLRRRSHATHPCASCKAHYGLSVVLGLCFSANAVRNLASVPRTPVLGH
jgi:hypothetical protein